MQGILRQWLQQDSLILSIYGSTDLQRFISLVLQSEGWSSFWVILEIFQLVNLHPDWDKTHDISDRMLSHDECNVFSRDFRMAKY